MAYVYLDGAEYSPNDIKVTIYGVTLRTVQSLNVRATKAKKNEHGFGSAEPTSILQGEKDYGGFLEVKEHELKVMRQAAIAQGGMGDLTDAAPSTATIAFFNGSQGLLKKTVANISFTEDDVNVSRGSGVVVRLPFLCSGVKQA